MIFVSTSAGTEELFSNDSPAASKLGLASGEGDTSGDGDTSGEGDTSGLGDTSGDGLTSGLGLTSGDGETFGDGEIAGDSTAFFLPTSDLAASETAVPPGCSWATQETYSP